MSGDVLVQKERGEFVNVNGFNAWRGFDERGFHGRFADWSQMDAQAIPVEPETVVVGSVRFVRRALERLGVRVSPLDYPARLTGYLGRKVWRTTFAEVRARVDEPGRAVFVKPFAMDKAFTGHLVASFRDLIRTAKWPDAMELWAAEPLGFVSEWRYFVRRGEVVGVGHYKGDPFRPPDASVVRAAVADYAPDAPAAYGIAFGVTDAAATHLVEVNDGFALGCLGLGPIAYSHLLEDRWRELVGSSRR